MSLEKLLYELDRELVAHAVSLCESPVEDFAAYKQRVGEYVGTKKTIARLKEALRKENDE
jgi:hypothetical protein